MKTTSTKILKPLAALVAFARMIHARRQQFDVCNEETAAANDASGFVVSTDYAANIAADKKDNWVQLSPFGRFPHPMGTQVFNRADADSCVNEFHSVWNTALGNGPKLGFGGLPWYVGHPDNDAFRAQYPDKSAKGRIKQLETRSDPSCANCRDFCNQTSHEPCREHGLFGNVKWNDEGKKIIANENFHGHSVNWRVKRVGNELHPVFLKSVGFTNEPNIPVGQITTANEKTNMAKSFLDYVNGLLKPSKPYVSNEEAESAMTDYANEHTKLKGDLEKSQKDAADRTAAIAALHKQFCSNEAFDATKKLLEAANIAVPTEGVLVFLANEYLALEKFVGADADLTKAEADLKAVGIVSVPEAGVVPFLANELITTRGKVTKAEADLTAANEKITKATTDLANARKKTATDICTLLLTGGFFNKVEHDAMVSDFANEATYDVTLTKAIGLKPKINVVSGVGILGNVDTQVKENTALQSRLQDICNEIRVKKPKISYLDAWTEACNTKEGREIALQMKAPEAPRREQAKKQTGK